jgi:hypothetical protein
MNGFTRFVLAGGLIVAASQLVAGPLADWNARREGAAVRHAVFAMLITILWTWRIEVGRWRREWGFWWSRLQ